MDLTQLLSLGGGPYVETKSHQLAILNTNVTLECALKNSYDSIFIITWHKNGTNGRTNVGTTGNQFHEEKVPVTTVTHDNNMKRSGLNILNTTKNDSCCFICSFYCNKASNCSTFSNTTCLTIYAPLTAYISKLNDSSNITCTATSYPPPAVTWIGATDATNHTRTFSNDNGTVSVESTLVIGSEDINVTCEVKHLENTTLISWSDHHKGHVSVSLIEVLFLSNSASVVSVGILIVLIVMIIILVYYKLIRKPGDLIRLYS
ncbi:glycoprotein vOX2-2 [Elephant endotheliotropic herpesvirus 1A]|uniref:Glycoprotein vOX2-2 n=1 Tax=Elephant endotheliotropic herpesvirus 1A TaxID=759753 RepID=M1R9V8_ELHV1|nr:glycoprotein vOX2-2 [Elephant endotheliotropic herpesvirus 1A]